MLVAFGEHLGAAAPARRRHDPASTRRSSTCADWIRPGDGIVIGQGTAEPLTLTEALVRQRGELGGVRAFLAAMFSDTFLPGAVDGIELTGMGGVGSNRRLIQAGAMDVIPSHVSQNDRLHRRRHDRLRRRAGAGQPARRARPLQPRASAPTTRARRSTRRAS